MNSAHRDQSGRTGRSRAGAGSNQCLKPYVLRDSVGGGNSQCTHELATIFLIREKPASRFRSFLLETLECEHTAVVGLVRKKRDCGVIFSERSRPPQAFILWLFAGQRVLVEKNFGALAYCGLTLQKVELILEQRYPRIGAGATNENTIVVVQIAHPQTPGIAHSPLRLQRSRHSVEGDDVGYVRERCERRVRHILAQPGIDFINLPHSIREKIPANVLIERSRLPGKDTGHPIVAVSHNNNRLVSRIENLRRRPRQRNGTCCRSGGSMRARAEP